MVHKVKKCKNVRFPVHSKLTAKPARQANCRNACSTGEPQPVNRVRVEQEVRSLHVAHASYSRDCDHWTTLHYGITAQGRVIS